MFQPWWCSPGDIFAREPWFPRIFENCVFCVHSLPGEWMWPSHYKYLRTIRQVYTQAKKVQFQTRRAARNLTWRFLNQSSAFAWMNEKWMLVTRTTHTRTEIVMFRWMCSERTFCQFRRFSRIMETIPCYFLTGKVANVLNKIFFSLNIKKMKFEIFNRIFKPKIYKRKLTYY